MKAAAISSIELTSNRKAFKQLQFPLLPSQSFFFLLLSCTRLSQAFKLLQFHMATEAAAD
jgi:hypothetical protein